MAQFPTGSKAAQIDLLLLEVTAAIPYSAESKSAPRGGVLRTRPAFPGWGRVRWV
jgi:hypothetical protein